LSFVQPKTKVILITVEENLCNEPIRIRRKITCGSHQACENVTCDQTFFFSDQNGKISLDRKSGDNVRESAREHAQFKIGFGSLLKKWREFSQAITQLLLQFKL